MKWCWKDITRILAIIKTRKDKKEMKNGDCSTFSLCYTLEDFEDVVLKSPEQITFPYALGDQKQDFSL